MLFVFILLNFHFFFLQLNFYLVWKKLTEEDFSGFGGEYFMKPIDGESIVDSKDNKSFLQGYRSALNSKSNEESLVSRVVH